MYDCCNRLAKSEVCIVVETHVDGTYVRHMHTHVPRYRLSAEARYNLLRTLVFRFSDAQAELIVRSHLNRKGADPAAAMGFRVQVSHPEPGVLRHSCEAQGAARAWVDEVIAPEKFRQPG